MDGDPMTLPFPEDKVPLDQRRLWLEGFVRTAERVARGLPDRWPETARCVFVSYAYADVPVGKLFEVAFPAQRPHEAERTKAVIHAVTQEFGQSLTYIPSGWKTICVIDFPAGVPRLVERLPVVEGWGRNEDHVALCEQEVLTALLSRKPLIPCP
jgi:hypothetical protein